MKEINIKLYEIHEIPYLPSPSARLNAVETLGNCMTAMVKDFKDKKTSLQDFDKALRDVLGTLFTEKGLSYDPEDLIKDGFMDKVRFTTPRTP